MLAHEWMGMALIVAGPPFFLAAGVGLVRFPDTYSRLHALTKADNLGLGFVLAGVALVEADALVALKLAAVWLLFLAGSATVAHLVARALWRRGGGSWRQT
jgi:multicomponent Na+:H+ antiporter subunit G